MDERLESLKKHVESRPFLVLRLDDEEWDAVTSSRNGIAKFSIAKKHDQLDGVKKNTPCLVMGSGKHADAIYLGLVSSVAAVSTLDSRLTIRRAVKIEPSNADALAQTISNGYYSKQVKNRLTKEDINNLSSNQSKHLLGGLSSVESNAAALKIIDSIISAPKAFNGNASLQGDAISVALATFGLGKGDVAESIELAKGKESGLSRISFMEDNAIELDAKKISGYELVGADLTGRAKFRKGTEELEVITANRRELEHCLGVDLIYINLTHKSVVALQYKMLEPVDGKDGSTDWIYRPDSKLSDEITRMKKFRVEHKPSGSEYRISSEFFYLKFVKRDALITNGSILMPLEHFERVRKAPSFKGARGGIRLSYEALGGNYLRAAPFMDLLRSGYIGSHADTTDELKTLIEEILTGNKAVIAAIQKPQGKV
ncbi:MAG: hypothetical protein JSR63_06005 [Proteobacteria bacterium]|nr:hypothetical protein [Pseudomonadota bacterium]